MQASVVKSLDRHRPYLSLARKLVPMLSNEEVVRMVSQMRRFHAPMILNAENFGLSDLTFAETEPVAALDKVR